MLAYELYLANRTLSSEAGRPDPVKKIFVDFSCKKSIKIDIKTLEEYGGKTYSKTKSIQEIFSMPLITEPGVGLPDKGTGSNSKPPYLKINGEFIRGTCILSISGRILGKKDKLEQKCTFSLKDKKFKFEGNSKIVVRIDTENYFISKKNYKEKLFDAYVAAGIVDRSCQLLPNTTRKICEAFFNFAKKRVMHSADGLEYINGKFKLIVLPRDGEITYSPPLKNKNENEEIGQVFEDSFGINANGYATTPTKNAKFISYDDIAFTINCTKGQDFYKNLGIGDKSIQKINFHSDYLFRISGLEWYFLSLTGAEETVMAEEEGAGGLYEKLLYLYKKVIKSGNDFGDLKIVCAKTVQSKKEILLCETIPVKRLSDILMLEFVGGQGKTRPWTPPLFETTLLERRNSYLVKEEKIFWNDYLYFVRFWLNDKKFEREKLISKFSEKVRGLISLHINSKRGKKELSSEIIREINTFYENASFCIKLLTKDSRGDEMDHSEDYAYRIGKIVGKYIAFKRSAEETTGSTEDILTYSKYDRERLRFVFTRIALGLSLSKAESLKRYLEVFIKSTLPNKEIDEENASKDYSYFFYKGVFECLGGDFNES